MSSIPKQVRFKGKYTKLNPVPVDPQKHSQAPGTDLQPPIS